MAKLNRERSVLERRVRKQARKDARKRAAAEESASPSASAPDDTLEESTLDAS